MQLSLPEVLRHAADFHFGVPPGALKSYKIALVSPLGAKVRPRSPRKTKKCPLGVPRVAKVAKKEPKRLKLGAVVGRTRVETAPNLDIVRISWANLTAWGFYAQ